MGGRAYEAGVYAGLKAATGRLIDRHGGLDGAAEASRVSRSTLHQYQDQRSQTNEATFAAVDVVLDLERACGPIVTRELARALGFDLVPRAAATSAPEGVPSESSLAHHALAVGAAGGALQKAMLEALQRSEPLSSGQIKALERCGVGLQETVQSCLDAMRGAMHDAERGG